MYVLNTHLTCCCNLAREFSRARARARAWRQVQELSSRAAGKGRRPRHHPFDPREWLLELPSFPDPVNESQENEPRKDSTQKNKRIYKYDDKINDKIP